MGSAIHVEYKSQIASELIRLLHQNAGPDEFAQRLAEVEAMPDAWADKSSLVETVRMAMAVRNRMELQQQREHGMLAVIESAQELSSRLDLTSLLRTIVAKARNLLGSDLAWLSVLHAERGEFQVLVADGALSQTTQKMVARRHHGVASIVMSSRTPFTTADYLSDSRFVHDANLDATFHDEGIAALAGVPLMWEGEVIGLLFVADRYHRTHTAQSLSVMCTLATHAAVALRNARDFERANAALQKADQACAQLEGHVRNIQAAAEAHEQMTALLARGASLATLCQSVAQLMGAGLLVLDEAAQVVSRGAASSYEGMQAQAYAPSGEHSAAIAAALRESRQIGRSVHAYEAGGESCRVMPVIGGEDVLGSIVLFHAGPLDEVAIRTFERSSSVIGIVLLSQERMEASRSRSVATLLRGLVSARQDETAPLANAAERHGVNLLQPLALFVVEMQSPNAGYAARRLRSLAAFSHALVDEIDGVLVILSNATRALDLREAISTRTLREFDATYRGVMSRPIGGPAEIPALFTTLRRAVLVLGRLGVKGSIVGQNELALYSTLFETHDQSSLGDFLESTIGPLIAYDRKRGAELTATLLSYFDCNQNAKETALRLQIHVNTVRQRLATIEDLLGHWGQASRALEIHMALRLWSLGEKDR